MGCSSSLKAKPQAEGEASGTVVSVTTQAATWTGEGRRPFEARTADRGRFARTQRLRGSGTATLLRAVRSLNLQGPKGKRNTLPWCQTHYVRGQSGLCSLLFERKTLKRTPRSSPKAGDAGGGSPGDAPLWGGCSASAEVLSEEGCWTGRRLPVGSWGGSRLIPPTAPLRVLTAAFAVYWSTALAGGSLLSGGRAEGEREEGWGGTGTLLHRRWTVFLSSLPKGKEKASGGYSRGGSNSLFFHPAGERILPSALRSPAPQARGVTHCCPWPQHHTAPTRWVGLKVLTAPLGYDHAHRPPQALTGWAGDERVCSAAWVSTPPLGAGTLPGAVILVC